MKKMLTVGALLLSAALLFGQTSEVAHVTSGLIEDNAIDQLDFGTEDGKGLTFVQFIDSASTINFGWGNWISDSFWLSFYDEWNNTGRLSDRANVTKTYGTKDGINIDYTDTTKTYEVGGPWNIDNTLAVGLGFGNFGMQISWDADWAISQTPGSIGTGSNIFSGESTTTSSEGQTTTTGTTTAWKYDKIKHFNNTNTFAVNFDGVGIKDVGSNDFYAQLNGVTFNWQQEKRANTYESTTTVNGKTTQSITADAVYSDNTFTPGLAFELGMNLSESDLVTTKLIFEDAVAVGFKGGKQKKTYTSVNDTNTQTVTNVYEYQIKPGKYFSIENTLTPVLKFDFNFDENLQLVAAVQAGIYTGNTNSKASTYERITTATTFTKANGNTTIDKHTYTDYYNSNKDNNTFTVKVAPVYALGLVYQIKPGKTNLNFGVDVERGAYQWEITKNTNANINYKDVHEETDAAGNTTGSTSVTVNNGGQEYKSVTYTAPTGISGDLYLGATWFFSENVKLDAYWSNNFASLTSGTNSFGIDLCVKF